MTIRRQLAVLAAFLAVYAFLAFLALVIGYSHESFAQTGEPTWVMSAPTWLLGILNAGVILVLYGFLGTAGLWFARRLELPGVFREGAAPRDWMWVPMALGVATGVALVIIDAIAASMGDWGGFEHPPFPLSIIASATAGIGEEIMFRMFVLGLWAFLLNLVMKRWGARGAALWGANVLAALAFGTGHIPATMMLLEVTTVSAIPPLVLGELFLLNGIVGLVAGERYLKEGLVAAVGVHFWTDVVWHVLNGLMGGA